MEFLFPYIWKPIKSNTSDLPAHIQENRIANTLGNYAHDTFGYFMRQKFICNSLVSTRYDICLNQPLNWRVKPSKKSFYLSLWLLNSAATQGVEQWPAMLPPNTWQLLSLPQKPTKIGLPQGSFRYFQIRFPVSEMKKRANKQNKIDWLLKYAAEGLDIHMQQITYKAPQELIMLYNKFINQLQSFPFDPDKLGDTLWKMLFIYVRRLHNDITQSGLDSVPLSESIIDLIRSKPEEKISIKNLATHFNTSITPFKKKCEAELGIPPGKFIQIQRLQWAAEILLTDKHSLISDIACQVGYQDVRNFRNLFKEQFHKTPSKFRASPPRK